MKSLSVAQQDALVEICNVGVSQAARQLSTLLGDEIIITVPNVLIVSIDEAAKTLNVKDENNITAVSQYLHGDFEGAVSLLFHTEEGKSLIKSLIGSLHVISGVDLRDLEHEALVEIGNIIISSCMSSMANFLGEEISFGVPTFRETEVKQLFTPYEKDHAKEKSMDAALIISTTLQAAKSEVSGALVIAFTMESASHLLHKVDEMVQQYGSDVC
jgi:chemotaxis protein CheC